MPTPHNAAQKGDFAKTVLMPGDPLRAEFIAKNFLENPRKVTDVRGMLGFTGTYHGKPISVMGGGMGMPSIGIYSYELFTQYDVENIIRIGSAGSYTEKAKLFDVVLATSAVSESSYAKVQSGFMGDETFPSEVLCEKLRDERGCLAVEMESFALFHNAKVLGKNAACLLTISDSFVSPEKTTAEQRQKSFTDMMKIALTVAE